MENLWEINPTCAEAWHRSAERVNYSKATHFHISWIANRISKTDFPCKSLS